MLNKIKTFIEEVVAELKKVSWTPRKDLINATFIVLASAICLGLFITAVDLVVSRSLTILMK